MRTVETNISWGYLSLIETFAEANNLVLEFESRIKVSRQLITIRYEDDSDTDLAITFMSIRHLGFENMLCDYLQRCGVPCELIAVGNSYPKRDMEKLDTEWEEHRKKLGFR